MFFPYSLRQSGTLPNCDNVVLFPPHGYDDETLFKDKRFQLTMTLQQNNLLQNSYAKQKVLEMPTGIAHRRDLKHTNLKES